MKFTLRNCVDYLQTATLLTASFTCLLPICACVVSAKDSPEQQAQAKHEESVYTEIAKAPEKARSQRNPFENDPDAIAAGSKLFAQHCAECHGNMAEGGKKGPSLREEEVQGAAPGALFWVLTNGVVRRGMPVWSKLPEPQRWQIVSFLKSLRETEHVSSLNSP